MSTRILVVLVVLGLGIVTQAQTPNRKMAVTIDDLPYVTFVSDDLAIMQRGTERILTVLKAHRAPAVGFVNERKLGVGREVEARTDLLRQWVRAGMILGNHTYSHPDFNQRTIAEFQDEIVKGDTITRRLMSSKKPYQLYFRHPMTHTGDTVEKKEAIEKFLARRGYKVTPHTIENSDFIFNVVYALAVRDKDEATAQKVREAYLDFTMAATEFAEKISPQIFGREVTQTFLIHANDLNAACLDDLLKRLEARGYRFVSLDEAFKDPAYQTKDTVISKMGPTWLWRWSKSLEMNLSFRDDPDPPEWVMATYKQWLSTRYPQS